MFNPSQSFLQNIQKPQYQTFGQRLQNFTATQAPQYENLGGSFMQDYGEQQQPQQQQGPGLLRKAIGFGRLFAI